MMLSTSDPIFKESFNSYYYC